MEGQPTENNQPSELNTIRDILMGNHIEQYSNNFNEIADKFKESEANTNNKLNDLENKINDHFAKLEKAIDDRLTRLENLLTEQVNHLNHRINKVSTTDKVDLGKMLAEMSQKLIQNDD